MKTSSVSTMLTLASITAISLACTPALRAQTNPNSTDTTQNSKTVDSTADSSSTTGTPPQPDAQDKTNSKDTTDSLDKNPSNASTDSGQMSATKDPNATSPDQMSAGSSETHHSRALSDREFILKAAQGGMTEVQLGKLAQENASSSEVKEFGARMVTDHSKANSELMAIAQQKGVTVPSTLDAKHQAAVDRLQRLSGADFDRAYVKAMVRDHEKDAAEFRDESTSAQDPDVKNFAGNTLKVIEMHLSDIKSIQSNLK